MIRLIFDFAGDIVEVRVTDTNCLFRTNKFGGMFSTIEGLRLDKSGVIKEFPEFKDDKEWREKAIGRFKEKIKSYKTEEERAEYIKEDLKKYGYIPLYLQMAGFRPKKLT